MGLLRACGEANFGGVDALVETSRAGLETMRALEAAARKNLAEMRRLPAQLRAENAKGLVEMKARYIAFLAAQGPIRVRGKIAYDGQSGGDHLEVTLDSIQSIASVDASGLSVETERTILEHPGRVLNKNGTIELTANATIHTYETTTTRSEAERGPPVTLEGAMSVRITREGATSGHSFASMFPIGRVGAELLTRV